MMRLRKKVAAALLATVMLSILSQTVLAAFSDVDESSGYTEAVEFLTDCGVLAGYEDGSFRPDSTITRAEFSAVVCRMLGVESEATRITNSSFSDVADGNWAAGYIAKASELGIVNGYGGGLFGPSDSVTYEQAVKMLVCACGYGEMAESYGGYPAGYLSAAEELAILDERADQPGAAATRGTVAQLVYNTILYVLTD